MNASNSPWFSSLNMDTEHIRHWWTTNDKLKWERPHWVGLENKNQRIWTPTGSSTLKIYQLRSWSWIFRHLTLTYRSTMSKCVFLDALSPPFPKPKCLREIIKLSWVDFSLRIFSHLGFAAFLYEQTISLPAGSWGHLHILDLFIFRGGKKHPPTFPLRLLFEN